MNQAFTRITGYSRDLAIGFNCRFLIEMGEETGSPGLRGVCEANRELLAADETDLDVDEHSLIQWPESAVQDHENGVAS